MLYEHYKDPSVKTRHANTAVVMINGTAVAEIAGLSVRESGGTDGSYVVGDAKPKEHLHNRWSASGSISRFVWRDSVLNDWTVGAKGLLDIRTIEIAAMDEVDGKVLFTLTGVTLSDRSMNIQANQRIMSDLSFLAMDIVDGDTASSNSSGYTSSVDSTGTSSDFGIGNNWAINGVGSNNLA